MALIADILLIAGAVSAGLYCLVLSRRLTRFTDLERGVGGAVAVLSAQVDDMTKALDKARDAAGVSAAALEATTARAESVAQRLELMVAAMHDLPDGFDPEPERTRRMVWRRARSAEPSAAPAFSRAVRGVPEAAE